MKIVALLLLLSGVGLTIFAVLFGFFLLAMSFDAPGAAEDPKAWVTRLLLFVPALISAALLWWAFRTYLSGNFLRSALIGAAFPLLVLGMVLYFYISDAADSRKAREEEIHRLE